MITNEAKNDRHSLNEKNWSYCHPDLSMYDSSSRFIAVVHRTIMMLQAASSASNSSSSSSSLAPYLPSSVERLMAHLSPVTRRRSLKATFQSRRSKSEPQRSPPPNGHFKYVKRVSLNSDIGSLALMALRQVINDFLYSGLSKWGLEYILEYLYTNVWKGILEK